MEQDVKSKPQVVRGLDYIKSARRSLRFIKVNPKYKGTGTVNAQTVFAFTKPGPGGPSHKVIRGDRRGGSFHRTPGYDGE